MSYIERGGDFSNPKESNSGSDLKHSEVLLQNSAKNYKIFCDLFLIQEHSRDGW